MTTPTPESTPADRLAAYVNAPSVDDFVRACATEAQALVGTFVANAAVPDEILNRAMLEVGSELYHRKQAPNGISQFADGMGTPVRVARDPMVGAYPLLRRYVVTGL